MMNRLSAWIALIKHRAPHIKRHISNVEDPAIYIHLVKKFGGLNFGHCDLFGTCDLLFEIFTAEIRIATPYTSIF